MENPYIAIPLEQIHVDPRFNARLSMEPPRLHAVDEEGRTKGSSSSTITIDELVRSLQVEGQLVPVEVRPRAVDGYTYSITFGFRRLQAMRIMAERGIVPLGAPANWLHKPTINALVMNISDDRAFLRNISENIARRDLTKFELANACHRLKTEYKMESATVADKLNLSKSHVLNLTNCIKSLHPTILQAWRNENDACKVDSLVGWSALEHEAQLVKFDKAQGISKKGKEDDEESENGGKEKKTRDVKRPGYESMNLALEAVKQSAQSKDWKAGATAALAFATGQSKGKLGSVYEEGVALEAAKVEAFKAAEAEKAEKHEAKAQAAREAAKTGIKPAKPAPTAQPAPKGN